MASNHHRASQLFVLLASEFNGTITRALLDGAREVLTSDGVSPGRIKTVWVPGAFELPVAAARAASTLKPQAIIALGCVIKGETPQYAAIGHAVAEGLVQVSVSAQIPVTFGVIVAESLDQARARAGLPAAHPGRRARAAQAGLRSARRGPVKAGKRIAHRGREAARAALAMVRLFRTRL